MFVDGDGVCKKGFSPFGHTTPATVLRNIQPLRMHSSRGRSIEHSGLFTALTSRVNTTITNTVSTQSLAKEIQLHFGRMIPISESHSRENTRYLLFCLFTTNLELCVSRVNIRAE
jgi:hypothetical protein